MKRRLYVFIPLILLGLLVGWRIAQRQHQVAEQASQRQARTRAPASVQVAPAVIRDITHSFTATGNVEAPLSVKIATKITGRIQHLEVREGDRVTKGQVLVRIDPSEVEANVQQQRAMLSEDQYRLAQAQLNQDPANVSVNTQIRQQEAATASATADYNQVRENYNAQLAAASANVSDTQSRIENAQAAIASANANLNNANLKLARAEGLYKKGFTSTQAVDDARAAVRVQQSAVEIAQGQLKSALAQKDSAEQQASIVKTKGKADIEAAKAKMNQAQAALDYAKSNSAQKPAYEQSLSALRAGVTAARASVKSAEARRADTVLRSPLNGFVTGRYADPGAISTPGQPILNVQFIDQIWVSMAVPEEIIPKVHTGQEARITLDSFPGRVFLAKVIQINPSADLQSRQFTVRVALDNSDGLLKPGMFARVAIGTERIKDAIVVPREAVKHDRDSDYVMVVAGDTAERRSVIIGAEDASGIAIKAGVNPGEKVITLSASPVRDGQPVNLGGRQGKGGPAAKGRK